MSWEHEKARNDALQDLRARCVALQNELCAMVTEVHDHRAASAAAKAESEQDRKRLKGFDTKMDKLRVKGQALATWAKSRLGPEDAAALHEAVKDLSDWDSWTRRGFE